MTVEGKFSDFDLVYSGGYMKRTSHTVAEYSDYSVFYDRVFGSGAYWVGNNGKPIMPEEFVIGGGYFEKWSHEIRLSTPADKPVRATVGLFIQRQLHNISQLYTMPGYGYMSVLGGQYNQPTPNPDGFANALSIPGFENAIWFTDEQRVDRDKAAFAQVTWDMTSQLALTGGIRRYNYENSLQGFFGYSATLLEPYRAIECFAPASTAYAPCTNLNAYTSANGWVPRVNLTYKYTPDVMVYATFSKGFRPGGVNRVSTGGVLRSPMGPTI